ncbi:hypothetical protein BKA56DRAFT_663416 [Ilyonectria sp. MPI-CAGE-AT-0026]|nr:hypothetical protein BKA56DRAFT_663416 [Ilyonectria sp. MPI-CAGE-AT-0026]
MADLAPSDFSYDGNFSRPEAAYDALERAQRSVGYVVAKTQSKRCPTGIVVRIDVRCHASGTYRAWSGNRGKYKTSSAKTNCPFHMVIYFMKDSSTYGFKIISNDHNHEPSAMRYLPPTYEPRPSGNLATLRLKPLSKRDLRPEEQPPGRSQGKSVSIFLALVSIDMTFLLSRSGFERVGMGP